MKSLDFMGGRVPTTDEMDKTTPEDRYKLVAMCDNRHWHHFTGSRDRIGNQLEGESCPECGTTKFIGGSLISERTWKPDWKPTVKTKKNSGQA